MSRLGWRPAGVGCALLTVWLAAAVGCQQPASELELRSYKDPYFPEPYHLTLQNCVFRVDASGDRHIAARAFRATGESESGPITQFLHVHLFWQPKPGRTFANSTGVNALMRYVIVTPTGTAAYAGTGFVYPKGQRGETLTAEIESASLRLESQSGTPAEVLGDVRLHGTLVARRDEPATVDLIGELDRHAAGR